MQNNRIFPLSHLAALLLLLALSAVLVGVSAETPDETRFITQTKDQPIERTRALGRGISVAFLASDSVQALGYNWTKTYKPPTTSQPVKVLYRHDIHSGFSGSQAFHDLAAIAINNGDYIDAYEIGNEPNIIGEWLSPPKASAYVYHLCEAYRAIKIYDPTAIVVSAGLAPVGRIDGVYDGHFGHDGQRQDEREFIEEFIIAGGHHCADVIGFHPMGFRADFDAAPDVMSSDPDINCTNGLCFRTVEKFHEKLTARGIDLPIWATEVGWIVQPPAHCLTTSSWSGRAWQIVSPEKRDQNIAGIFDYAVNNYPWMENIFVWNLNFDDAPWYDQCEQMRYYSHNIGVPPTYPHTLYLPVIQR